MLKEFYVGFLLLLRTFLYLSHLIRTERVNLRADANPKILQAQATLMVSLNEKDI